MQISTMLQIALVGSGATLVLDAWLALLKQMGVPTLNFALLGRWVGYALRGRVYQPMVVRSLRRCASSQMRTSRGGSGGVTKLLK